MSVDHTVILVHMLTNFILAEKECKKAEKAAKVAQKEVEPADTVLPSKTSKSFVNDEQKLPEYVEQTLPGGKQIFWPYENDSYAKIYLAEDVEWSWFDWLGKEGFFKREFSPYGEVKPAGKFVISLHCGHTLGSALQDLLIRWHRMKGFITVGVPVCDHAGISTQSAIEKMLWNRYRQTRHDLSLFKLIKIVWS